MTDKKQPEALRLAGLLELAPENGVEPQTTEDAAAELRRLHTENTALQQGYAAARLEIESLKAQLADHADELVVAHLDGRMRERSVPAGEYPALPKPGHRGPEGTGSYFDSFTADQMRAYADATCAMRAAQPAGAQQPGAVYAALPEPFIGVQDRPWGGHAEVIRSAIGEEGVVSCFNPDQMRAFADATHALRASHGQAPALAAPQQEAQEQAAWNSLTDEDRERAMKSMPDMLEGFLKKWGWLHFANAIENICREKNPPNSPASQGNALDAARYRWLRQHSLAAGQGSITVELDDRANGHFSRSIFLAELDAAIDAARAAQKGKK